MNSLDLSLAELYPAVTFNFPALNACNLISTSVWGVQKAGRDGGEASDLERATVHLNII